MIEYRELEMASFERKWVAENALAETASAWLNHVCSAHARYPDEIIHTVYYDTPSLASYSEKVNGDFNKTKVRLRWYECAGSHDGNVFLEIKKKTGGSRNKTRREVSCDVSVLPGMAGLEDFTAGCEALRASGLQSGLPPGLAPAIHLSYRRQRFVCPATLYDVALDTDIEVRLVNRALIGQAVCGNIQDIVLEVKGSERRDIPWMWRLFYDGFRNRSFSKYGAGVALSRGEDDT